MNRATFALAFACLVGMEVAPALAQAVPNHVMPWTRRGAASVLANGLSVRSGSTTEATLVKPPRDQASPPVEWVFDGGTDYSLEKMFPADHDVIEIDAHSTGNEIIPATDGDGIPNVLESPRWLALSISVRDGAIGSDGSWYEVRRNAGLSNGADVVSYYFEGSEGINPALVGSTVVEQGTEDLGYPGTGAEDVDALDFGLGVMTLSPGVASEMFFTNESEYYFSVSNACVPLLSSPFAVDNTVVAGQPVDANGATIYVVRWTPGQGGGGSWSFPEVYRSATQLDLDVAVDDIDAIAVDRTTLEQPVIFSTQPSDSSQLLIHHYNQDLTAFVGPETLRNESGAEVTAILGADDVDDVDAVCGFDPEPGSYDRLMGTPRGPAVGNPPGMSMTRGVFGEQQVDVLFFHVSGKTTPMYLEYSLDHVAGFDPEQATWLPFYEKGEVSTSGRTLEFVVDTKKYFAGGAGVGSVAVRVRAPSTTSGPGTMTPQLLPSMIVFFEI